MTLFNRLISSTLPVVPKPLVRTFSRRYIAGTTIDEAFGVVRRIHGEGAMVTLDILGEFIRSVEQARANTRAYEDLLRRIHDEGFTETHVSVKLTALGLLLDRDRCLEHMVRLLELAASLDNFVRIDMEDSSCTTPTLEIYRELHGRFGGRIGVVLQSRLRRTLQDIADMGVRPANFRICKGIYVEPPEIAHTDADAIRDNFVGALERMFERGDYVGIATHDDRLVVEAKRMIREHGIARERYEFQMLLGVRDALRRTLLDEGHRLRVYVPYGEHWYQYSVRRLRENPEIAGHAFRALFRRS